MKAYVLYHRGCGHPLALSANRANLENHDGAYDLRIRIAVAADVEAFAARKRCEACSIGIGLNPGAPVTSNIHQAVNQAARLHPQA